MTDAGCDAVGGCPLAGSRRASRVPATVERRGFVADAVAAVVASLGVAAFARDAGAVEVRWVSGVGAGAEKRYPLPATDGVTIDKAESVIIARFEGRVYAFALACPHQNTALRWDARASRFQCPRHKSRYRPDGVFIDGRATRGMDRFAIRRDGDSVVVNFDAMYAEDENASAWQAAFVQL